MTIKDTVMVEIPITEYYNLIVDSQILRQLNELGVDNWSGYEVNFKEADRYATEQTLSISDKNNHDAREIAEYKDLYI